MRNLRPASCMLCLLCVVAPRALHAQASPPVSAEAATPVKHPASLADALQLYRTGRFDSAIQEYQELENGPQAALAYVGLARAYLKEKKPSDAYAAAARSKDLAPQSPETKVALGEVYFRKGEIAEAEKEFVDVINSGANNARAYLGLARVSRAASLYQRAKNMIDRAHQIDPSDPDITRAWLSTLTLTERISALKAYLGQEADDNAEGKLGLQRQLALLQGELDNPGHQCRMVSKIGSTQTDLKYMLIDANHLRGFGLEVKVNAVSSRLLLDTGAGGILLNRKIAEKAGIKKLVQTNIRGIGDRGPAGGYIGYADSIQIGELQFQDCDVDVIDTNSAAGEAGMIGADVFSHFLVEIDLPNQKFRLSQLPPRPDETTPAPALEAGSTDAPRFHDRHIGPEMAGYSPVFRFGHLLLIPTKLNDSADKLFILDTGAFNNTISPAAAREVTKISTDSDSRVTGLNGAVKNVYRGDELTLTFGNLRQKNEDIVAFDTKNISDSIGTEVSGALGFAMLRMLDLKIDYRDGLVKFSFDPKRWQ